MGVAGCLRGRYDSDLPSLTRLYEYLSPDITRYASVQGYAVRGRIKTLESAAEKLETGRFQSWRALDDLVAFTVVVPTQTHETRVLDWLTGRYSHLRTRSRLSTPKPPDVFRFDAARWYGTVGEHSSLDERVLDIVFEVQIKTVFEDAWSQVTHDLVYKTERPEWRRLRLAAQLKALVEQIDILLEHFEASAGQVAASPHPETEAKSDAILQLQNLIEVGGLDSSLAPGSWSRLLENILSIVAQTEVPGKPHKRLGRLIDSFSVAVGDGTFVPLLSTSLFDAVVAFGVGTGQLVVDNRFLVASEELADMYLLVPPKPIDLT